MRGLAKTCCKRFDDLTNRVFSGHHRPLKTSSLFLYFLGLNLSTEQSAKVLCLNKGDAHYAPSILRGGVVDKKPEVKLSSRTAEDACLLCEKIPNSLPGFPEGILT